MNTTKHFNLLKRICLLAILLSTTSLSAQNILDVSVGASFQDDANAQIAFRRQLSDKFQMGLEFQYGFAKYRFIETNAIREGYAITASLPFSYRLATEERIQLYGIGRLGARFQGIIDPDGNDMRDSILNSNGLVAEAGLISSFSVGENSRMQGGISFPMAFERSPLAIQEYTWVKLHLGAARSWNNTTLFTHGNIGSAFGASGDTYKYIWSVEAGIRFNFGDASANQQFVHTAF